MIWQMAHIPGSQVAPYLDEGWEPFAVVPGVPFPGSVMSPEPIVYLKRAIELRPTSCRAWKWGRRDVHA